jgi:hypothetical protein
MTTAEVAWQNYQRANQRIDRCKEVDDRTGLAIAEASAAHWLAEWMAADALAAPTGPTAPTAA